MKVERVLSGGRQTIAYIVRDALAASTPITQKRRSVMKRNVARFLVFGIVFLGVLAFSANGFAKTVLKCSSQWTQNQTGSKVAQWFADEIKKATNGEIEIKIYWSQALAKAGENLSLLRSGAIDMAEMSPAYFPSELPFFTVANSVPMGMDNLCQGSAIVKAFMERIPAFMEEAKSQNIRPLSSICSATTCS